MDEIIQVDPRSLKPYPVNYNDHPAEQVGELARSLAEFGQPKNIVVWHGHILAGHGLTEAAIAAGLTTIEARDMSEWSPEKAEAFLIADNETARMGLIDYGKLNAMVEQARAQGRDVPGVTPGRLAEIVAAARGEGAAVDAEPEPLTEVEAEKYHKKWQPKPGDMWQLGRHVIACLDSLDEANIKKIVGDSAVTFAFADPPYGINIVAANVSVGGGEAYDIPFGGAKNKGYVGGGARIKARTGLYPIQTWSKNRPVATDGGNGRDKPFGSKEYRAANGGGAGRDNVVDQGKYYPVAGDSTAETAKQSAALLLNLYPDACQVWWGANYYTDVLPPSPCWIIWDKDNTGNFADCEMAWTNQPTAARIFEHRWNGMLKASEQGQRRIHPTQKPVALARYCFENYGKPGDVVLDPFLGSGITVLAAEELSDRRVIGFELEPVYISVVLERWQQKTGQEPRRL